MIHAQMDFTRSQKPIFVKHVWIQIVKYATMEVLKLLLQEYAQNVIALRYFSTKLLIAIVILVPLEHSLMIQIKYAYLAYTFNLMG